MPIYDYHCKSCSTHIQILCEIEEMDKQICETCTDPLVKIVSIWANTPDRWGDSRGRFDRGLGQWVKNSMHREQIMKEKGLRHVSSQELDDAQHDEYVAHQKHEKDVSKFSRKLKETGSVSEATAYTFPVDE